MYLSNWRDALIEAPLILIEEALKYFGHGDDEKVE